MAKIFTSTVLCGCCLSLLVSAALVYPAYTAEDRVQFNRDVRPILSDACFQCHGPDKAKRKANLRLDTPEGATADLGGRRAIVAGDPGHSELFLRITATDDAERMPPPKSGHRLTAAQMALVRRWIEQGANYERHWAFLPPGRPETPEVRNVGWVHNPIDAFILHRLERERITPAPEASRTTLLRRVTLDLTGLPPTLAEIDAFLADSSADAYDKVVDRLLASPRYGERMVLEWLDAARYADSNGYQADRTRTMWPWRDQVIDALNRNQPFDQFTIEQLAGDLLPGASRSQKIASGFHRNHMLNGEGGRIPEESRVDYVIDRVDTTATVWLGLTLGCCRCHDHKYDPFMQKEYYRLFAYFNNLPETGSVDRGGNAAPVLALPTEKQETRLAALNATITDLEGRLKSLPPAQPTSADFRRQAIAALIRPLNAVVLGLPADYLALTLPRRVVEKQLADTRKSLDDLNKSLVQVMVMEERPQPRPAHVLVRGAYDKPGDPVSPGVIESLAAPPTNAPPNRLALARWLVDPSHPLTARVTVNRIWQIFFGAGLVKTTEDFGIQGEWPSHPELLDWLATEFVRFGWDVKAMHRLIVTSAAYRQSSRTTPQLLERDPENRLLARGPRHRLPAFLLRDQALAVSGLLVERLGGAPVRPYQPPGLWEEMSFNKITYQQDKGEGLYRRSLYTFWRRTVGPPTLFDTAARQVCTVRQARTNTPLHALTLLNDVTYVEAARKLAERALKDAATTDERIALMFRLVTTRSPSTVERQVLTDVHQRALARYRANPEAALKLISAGESPRDPRLDAAELAAAAGLATVVLNLDEAVSKE